MTWPYGGPGLARSGGGTWRSQLNAMCDGETWFRNSVVLAEQIRSILASILQSHRSMLKRRFSTQCFSGGPGLTRVGLEAVARTCSSQGISSPRVLRLVVSEELASGCLQLEKGLGCPGYAIAPRPPQTLPDTARCRRSSGLHRGGNHRRERIVRACGTSLRVKSSMHSSVNGER